MIPVLEYKITDKKLLYHYTNIVDGFAMPLKIRIDEKSKWITPTADWKTEKSTKAITSMNIDRNFYIDSKKIN